ncbi:MAG: response regulator transcription factor [Chloroflexi bacterium]|nr:response regulator transcription factor [Chloroflexota bacterium]
MSKALVLVVDDEPRYLKLVRYNLETAGYEVVTAPNGEEALSLAAGQNPDLIILDIRLPGIDGYEVCTRLREFSSVPIIMLTAKGEEQEKVQGLRLGADDYVTKPFAADEFMARVEAVLRRSHIPELNPPIHTVGALSIDCAQRKVTVGGREVSLSPTEYRLLQCLAVNAGRVVVQEELQEKAWGPEYREHYEGLRVFIRRLRQKIEKDPEHPTYIITKPGIGYMLATPA